MGSRKKPRLVKIIGSQYIPPNVENKFRLLVENGLLLALKEKGYLTDAQYEYACKRRSICL